MLFEAGSLALQSSKSSTLGQIITLDLALASLPHSYNSQATFDYPYIFKDKWAKAQPRPPRHSILAVLPRFIERTISISGFTDSNDRVSF